MRHTYCFADFYNAKAKSGFQTRATYLGGKVLRKCSCQEVGVSHLRKPQKGTRVFYEFPNEELAIKFAWELSDFQAICRSAARSIGEIAPAGAVTSCGTISKDVATGEVRWGQ